MEFIRDILIVVVVVILGVAWFLAGYSSRKAAKKEAANINNVSSKTMNLWVSLSEDERKELNSIDALFDQEVWVEQRLTAETRASVKPEQIILELANKGYIRYGSGLPRRLALASELTPVKKPAVRTRTRAITRSRVASLRKAHQRKVGVQKRNRPVSHRVRVSRKLK